jgi:hypothetical protein
MKERGFRTVREKTGGGRGQYEGKKSAAHLFSALFERDPLRALLVLVPVQSVNSLEHRGHLLPMRFICRSNLVLA